MKKDHDYCFVEMPDEDNKILKYSPEEKSLKAPFMIMQTQNVCLKKCIHVKIILKNVIEKKNLSIRLLVTHCLQVARLTQQKGDLIVTEIKTVWKGFVRI